VSFAYAGFCLCGRARRSAAGSVASRRCFPAGGMRQAARGGDGLPGPRQFALHQSYKKPPPGGF
jgi:hypothetical protein